MGKKVLLTTKQIKKEISKLPEWSINSKNTFLSRALEFPSHIDALVFIARITVHAEIMQHHPDITYTYRKLKIKISEHEMKGLTKADIKLAKKIEDLLGG